MNSTNTIEKSTVGMLTGQTLNALRAGRQIGKSGLSGYAKDLLVKLANQERASLTWPPTELTGDPILYGALWMYAKPPITSYHVMFTPSVGPHPRTQCVGVYPTLKQALEVTQCSRDYPSGVFTIWIGGHGCFTKVGVINDKEYTVWGVVLKFKTRAELAATEKADECTTVEAANPTDMLPREREKLLQRILDHAGRLDWGDDAS